MTGAAEGIPKQLNTLNLGLQPYDSALELQHRMVAARKLNKIDDTLILLEHPPVITLGRRGNESNILATSEWLADHGIQVYRVERGGDVTYHGPGQLMGYPIMDLGEHRKDVGWYMHSLEEVLIRALADFGVAAGRISDNIGVWLDERTKIAALGARIENWITYHGFALNVAEDIAHFELIVPCGLSNKQVTSMEEALGRPVDMAKVRERVVDHFAEVFDVEAKQASLDRLLPLLHERE
jgi:lipoate-protein ligase B